MTMKQDQFDEQVLQKEVDFLVDQIVDKLGQQTCETFYDFMHALEEKLGLISEKTIKEELHTSVLNLKTKKRYNEIKKFTFVARYENDAYKLDIIPYSKDCVEIFWIEAKIKRSGIGTDLMNTILDLADEKKVKVRTIPCDFDDYVGEKQYLLILRDWYRSFGFRPSPIHDPVFYYDPNKQ